MVPDGLSPDEKQFLLAQARQAIAHAVERKPLPPTDTDQIPPRLLEMGASFVTLTRGGNLRGCIGALEPYQSLIEDVREHAVAAAMDDYRFPPVQPDELDEIHIEISRLTVPKPMDYTCPEDLLSGLRVGIDGVVLRDGFRRATFLPQVWEKIPDPGLFLGYLCQKMGASMDLWKQKKLDVLVYQVEEFHE